MAAVYSLVHSNLMDFVLQACDGRVNPVYIVTGLTLASSLGYILPCSSMPNALTHSYGDLSIRDMVSFLPFTGYTTSMLIHLIQYSLLF